MREAPEVIQSKGVNLHAADFTVKRFWLPRHAFNSLLPPSGTPAWRYTPTAPETHRRCRSPAPRRSPEYPVNPEHAVNPEHSTPSTPRKLGVSVVFRSGFSPRVSLAISPHLGCTTAETRNTRRAPQHPPSPGADTHRSHELPPDVGMVRRYPPKAPPQTKSNTGTGP